MHEATSPSTRPPFNLSGGALLPRVNVTASAVTRDLPAPPAIGGGAFRDTCVTRLGPLERRGWRENQNRTGTSQTPPPQNERFSKGTLPLSSTETANTNT
ncbi:hypothetical protein EYF80_023983 [Liparis tanakae]|uniref:Uncharacterized protein n=1 Tax=Liparis tanakae TaxID=230148 RepID=A0A4Z2HJQ8_9TELE|nr:hypothetical protein EYF80_023983 [Liparis tanakae]